MKISKICLGALLVLMPAWAWAQVNVTLAWDASTSEEIAENPLKYRLYRCDDATFTKCTSYEAGQTLEYGPLPLAHGSTTWFYCTAYRYEMIVVDDGILKPGTVIAESGKSNVLKVRAFAPPGNPKNQRIRIE